VAEHPNPCEDIPFDAVQRLGLAFTPPEHEDGLRCHFDAGNYQVAVEPIIWRTYAQTLPPDALETTIEGHSTVYSNPEVDCMSTNLQRANDLVPYYKF
jgi:hypothetical protein